VNKIKKFLKRFGTDIAGYTCLILVIPVGSLPGPGGIPLLAAGLGLLSIHNQWARTLLEYVKKHSSSLREIFFPKKKNVELFWDIFSLCLFIGAFGISVNTNNWLVKIICTGLAAASTTVFMFNRARLERLQTKFSKR
jgi:hypothetical protein